MAMNNNIADKSTNIKPLILKSNIIKFSTTDSDGDLMYCEVSEAFYIKHKKQIELIFKHRKFNISEYDEPQQLGYYDTVPVDEFESGILQLIGDCNKDES